MKPKYFKNLIQILIFSSTILTQTGCDKTEENKLPTCTITSPGNGTEIVQRETVTITVSANDIDGRVYQVKLLIDGSYFGSTSSSPYNFDWETYYLEIGTYSIKAIVIDNSGGFASDEIEISLIPETGTITDLDGNIYSTVLIGSQLWMAENLKTTKYNDSTAIPLVTNSTAWYNLTTPGYCWYRNNEATSKKTYGALYNWYTVNTSKLCPTGWHIPSDAEWTQLIDYLGGRGVAGSKLKETGTTHWITPNIGATNESGFTGLPGGCRDDYGSFHDRGCYGNFWSATEDSSSDAWYRGLRYLSAGVHRDGYPKSDGHSVRCLKDN